MNISSIIGEMGNIGQANYAASKSGLFGLTKTLALEAAFQLERAGKLEEDGIGITVNTVAPGFVATEMLEHVPEKVLDGIKDKIPVGRLGRPDEIARVVHFLVADQSSFITGRSGPSTAGWTCERRARGCRNQSACMLARHRHGLAFLAVLGSAMTVEVSRTPAPCLSRISVAAED